MKNIEIQPGASATAEITPEKTEHLKGIAFLLLMWHHLFGIGYVSGWRSAVPGMEDITYITGQAGKICLAMFLFCSGYGIYKTYISKESADKGFVLKRLAKTLIPYWMVMIIAIVYLACVGKFKPEYLFMNLFALIHSDARLYVSFSWFIKLYILLILLLPLIRLTERKWKKNPIIDILIYIAVPFGIAVCFAKYVHEAWFTDIPSFLLSSFLFLLSWFPLFAVGMLFAKYDVYKKIRKITDKIPGIFVTLLSFIVICIVLFARYLVYEAVYPSLIFENVMLDFLFGPVIITAFLLMIDNMRSRSRHIIPFIGRNSVFYWLLSGMFFLNTSELQFIIKWPKISVLILLWTVLVLTPFVYCLSLISGRIIKLTDPKKKS